MRRVRHPRRWAPLAAALAIAGGILAPAPARADEVPAIPLELDIKAGDYPLYRSTVFPPIALDSSSGPSGRWPASAKASITRPCWDGPCEPDKPYTVTETLTFTGVYDPGAKNLTGKVVHHQETHRDEVLTDSGGGQLESLATVETTGDLDVTWSDADHRFTGAMTGTEVSDRTYWDYEPGPGHTGRHPVAEAPTTRSVTWVVRSPELASPTAQTTTVDDQATTGAAGTTSERSSDQGSSFPWVALVVGLLVALGVIAAVGVFRSWRTRQRTPRSEAQDKLEAYERGERDEQRRTDRGERELDRLGAPLIAPAEPEPGDDDEEGGGSSWSVTYLDTDGDGVLDTERTVEHRPGRPDRTTTRPYTERPPDPATKAYGEWVAEQISGDSDDDAD